MDRTAGRSAVRSGGLARTRPPGLEDAGDGRRKRSLPQNGTVQPDQPAPTDPGSRGTLATIDVRSLVRGVIDVELDGALGWHRHELLRKEVIQPHLPVRLPCYDFTPIADPTFGSSIPCGFGH